jgi:hypothetical protein
MTSHWLQAQFTLYLLTLIKNRYAVAYMAYTGSNTKNVNDVRFIFTFPTFEWGRLKYLGKYLPAL